jgi:hypothetical protein
MPDVCGYVRGGVVFQGQTMLAMGGVNITFSPLLRA